MPMMHRGIGLAVQIAHMEWRRSRRDERGLSQSTENAILLAGAVAIAIMVVALVSNFVSGKLGKLK